MLTLVMAVMLGQVNAEALKAAPWKAGVSLGADGSVAVARGNVVFLDIGAPCGRSGSRCTLQTNTAARG